MTQAYLICKETESKGYTDKKEKTTSQFGLFVGYLLNPDDYEFLADQFKVIQKKHNPAGEQLIIDNLTPEAQQLLRNDVFECLISNDVVCVYEALSAQELQSSYDLFSEMFGENKKKTEPKSTSDNSKLHCELFEGIFGKAISFFVDNYNDTIHLNVVSDEISEPQKLEFEKIGKQFITLFASTQDEASQETDIAKTTFEIGVVNSEFTLIANVLAHSINHHLEKEITRDADAVLCSFDTISEHPLAELMYGI